MWKNAYLSINNRKVFGALKEASDLHLCPFCWHSVAVRCRHFILKIILAPLPELDPLLRLAIPTPALKSYTFIGKHNFHI